MWVYRFAILFCFGICWGISAACGTQVAADNDANIGARLDSTERRTYPRNANVIDVTKAPYFAKGDGLSDDSEAVQKALSDVMGQHKLLYFPKGVYLISRTLTWSNRNSDNKEAWGFNYLVGENVNDTIIRLKDQTFLDESRPESLMWCGGFGSADWFHNYIENMTFDVGQRNPGAIGLQFYSNNSGAIRNCRIVAPVGSGSIGLDLGHRDMNGPLLVRDCEIEGFKRGICTAHSVNSQTFEHISLRRQTEFGIDNAGQTISVRGLQSENSVPVIRTYGVFCLLDARLNGLDGTAPWPAVINYNGGRIFLRDVVTRGYGRAVADVATPDWFAATRVVGDDKPGSQGPKVSEYCSHSTTQAFPSPTVSLRLPIKEPPLVPWDDPKEWANVDDFGADPTAEQDSSAAIQRAMDSGATTVFFPGSYLLNSTVLVRGKVRRIVGLGGQIDYFSKVRPDFRILDGDSPVVVLEHFANIHGGIECQTRRTLVFRSVADCDLRFGPAAVDGELYFEDFVTHDLKLNRQSVWARQLNIENEGTHAVNEAGKLWILGYKTERGGTLVETRKSGITEILGGYSYTTTAGTLAPMFVTKDAAIFTFFHEVCYSGDPFELKITETRGNETKTLNKDQAHTAPYAGYREPR